MMTAPPNALMLQSRMRFCVSTGWASLVPSRRIRSSSRRAGARHSASRRGRRRRGNGARRIARLILSPKWLCTSAATLWSGSCSTWLRLTINDPACRQVAPPIANSTACVAIPRTIAVTKSRSLAPSKGGKDRGATMNGTVASNEVTERKVVDSIWWTLRMSFGLVPLLAGLDKFFNLLTQWPKYVAPAFAHALPVTPQHFMYVGRHHRDRRRAGDVAVAVDEGLLVRDRGVAHRHRAQPDRRRVLRHRGARSGHGGLRDLAGAVDRRRARHGRRAAARDVLRVDIRPTARRYSTSGGGGGGGGGGGAGGSGVVPGGGGVDPGSGAPRVCHLNVTRTKQRGTGFGA